MSKSRSGAGRLRAVGRSERKQRRKIGWSSLRASQSKYQPHQGDNECERRRRRAAEIAFRRAIRFAYEAMTLFEIDRMTWTGVPLVNVRSEP